MHQSPQIKEISVYKILKCDPALFEKDLSNHIYIVTGANSGTGLATSEHLVRQGAHVIAACRRMAAGEDAIKHLSNESGTVELMELDLSSLKSVRRFVAAFKDKHDKLHGLVNNAGVMTPPKGLTEDGFETQFGVNYLGHFLLTELLHDVLKASVPCRIVCVSSVAHAGMLNRAATIDFDDLNFEKREYDAVAAYCQSKLAIVIYARHLAKRFDGSGVSVFSTHPGWIRSNLIRHSMPPWIQNVLMRPFSGLLTMMSAEDGAQTQLHCLLDDDAPNHSGEYYSQNSILYRNKKNRSGGWPMQSPNPLTYDDNIAERLYETSVELAGLKSK
jgi:NAD(P)-dependent dehydrogenase (short-subunit alcohol dehydrogenase family)